MHVTQNYETKAELQELMSVNKNIMSPKASKPCVGLIQDACVGAYFFSKKDTFFDRPQACQLLTQCRHIIDYTLPIPCILKPKALWSGKQLFSMLLPSQLYLRKNSKEKAIVIYGGQFLTGTLCKETLGASYGSIHHAICRLLSSKGGGQEVASRYLSDLQRMINWYLTERVVSIGIRDNITSSEVQDKLANKQDTLMQMVHTVYQKMMDEEKFHEKELEPHIYSLLKKGLNITSAIADNDLDDRNSIWAMVHSGSKGNVINIGQMTASLGQQTLDGGRIHGRPLSAFDPDCRHPAAKGYVRHSLYEGLTVSEFFDHAIGGREGLVDTAVKTSITGYLQRCLMQAMNDVGVEHDGTVRASNQEVVQFMYGGDGYDPSFLVRINLPNFHDSDDNFLSSHFTHRFEEYSRACDSNHCGSKTSWSKKYEQWKSHIQHLRRHLQIVPRASTELYSPFDLHGEVEQIEMEFAHHSYGAAPTDLTISYMFDEIHKLINTVCVNSYYRIRENFPLLMEYYLFTTLSVKFLIIKHYFTVEMFDRLLRICRYRFQEALVSAYEMVGSLSAESMGESCTQMTLNSVEWNTEILVNSNGINSIVKIGEWIDNILKQKPEKIQHIPENRTEFCELDEDISIPTVDDVGNVSLGKITAVTRHLPVGKLVRVKTRSGREVIATRSKSFLIWSGTNFVPTYGSDINVGDQVPVVSKCATLKQRSLYQKQNDVFLDTIVSIKDYESDHEYVYDLTIPSTYNFCIYNGLGMRDTFHAAGRENRAVSSGIPRLKELLYMSKKIKTPSTSIRMHPLLAANQTMLHRWQSLLEEIFLDDIIESYELVWEPDPVVCSDHFPNDKEIIESASLFIDQTTGSIFPHSRWVIRIVLNQVKLIDRGLLPGDIQRLILEHFRVSTSLANPWNHGVVLASYACMSEWILRIRIPDTHTIIQKSPVNTDAERKAFEKDFCLNTFYELSRTLRISGVSNITGSTLRKDGEDVFIDTTGSNLLDIWLLDGCDWTKTITNVIEEVHEYLGIEAACQLLFSELKSVMTMASANISDRHMMLLVDIMTRRGCLVPINRHGFNQYNHVLARASFEETLDNLTEAAMFSEIDPMSDLVSNMSTGQLIPAGTGRVLTKNEEIDEYEHEEEFNHHYPCWMPSSQQQEEICKTHVNHSFKELIGCDNTVISPTEPDEDLLADWIPPHEIPAHTPAVIPTNEPIDEEDENFSTIPRIFWYRPSSPCSLNGLSPPPSKRRRVEREDDDVVDQEFGTREFCYRPSSPTNYNNHAESEERYVDPLFTFI